MYLNPFSGLHNRPYSSLVNGYGACCKVSVPFERLADVRLFLDSVYLYCGAECAGLGGERTRARGVEFDGEDTALECLRIMESGIADAGLLGWCRPWRYRQEPDALPRSGSRGRR